MRDKQRTVLAVGAAALLIVGLFFVPWRVESSDDLMWGPIYRPPVTYTWTYRTPLPGARYAYEEATIDVGYLLLEVVLIGLLTGIGYALAPSFDRPEEEDSIKRPPRHSARHP